VKRFFENEFSGGIRHKVMTTKGDIMYAEVKDPLISYSEDVIKGEIKRFIHGYSNRFSPIEVPLLDGKVGYLAFKGHSVTAEELASGRVTDASPLISRKLTWCDVFYMAACECAVDKHILITRFPIDTSYNQFPSKFRINTIRETEPVYVNNTLYRHYPKIRQEDVGRNTSQDFIDTLNICNLLLNGIGGDYDGDTVSIKGVYTVEANEELDKYIKSKKNYIGLDGKNMRKPSNEAMQVLYNLTLTLGETEKHLTAPIF